jgi:hypothetical protein
MALDASIGTTTANSYALVAEADAYYVDMFNRPLWASSSNANKEAALVTASRMLDYYTDWVGTPVTDVQAMGWPRDSAYNQVGTLYSNTAIPMPVKFAVYELAYYILENGGLSFAQQVIDEVRVSSINVKFSENGVIAGIPDYIMSLVRFIGTSNVSLNGNAHTVRLVRS